MVLEITMLRDIPLTTSIHIPERLIVEWNRLLEALEKGQKGIGVSDALLDMVLGWCNTKSGAHAIFLGKGFHDDAYWKTVVDTNDPVIRKARGITVIKITTIECLVCNGVALTREQNSRLIAAFIALDEEGVRYAHESGKRARNSSSIDDQVSGSAFARSALLTAIVISAPELLSSQMTDAFKHFETSEKLRFLNTLAEYAEKDGVLGSDTIQVIKNEISGILRERTHGQVASKTRVEAYTLLQRIGAMTKQPKQPLGYAMHRPEGKRVRNG